MKTRIGLVSVVAALAACAATTLHLAPSSRASAAQPTRRCGADRWYVRTLQDRPTLLPARKTTIRALVRIPRPRTLPATRLAIEHRVVTVTALAGTATATVEANGDVRFSIQNNGSAAHMAAAMPHPFCNSRASAAMRRKMGAARVAFLKRACGIPATITGVLFFTSKRDSSDFRSAPSGIELRPVLGFTCPYN